MTVITDYQTLQTRIIEVLNRNDLVPHVTSFIQMACDDINGDLMHPRMNDTLVMTAELIVAVPVDYERAISITQMGQGEVYYYPIDEFDALCTTTQGGRIYTIIGENFLFAPWLVDSDLRLIYKRDMAALSNANPSNWLLDAAASVYLYGALKHSAPYLIEDDRLGMWAEMYNSSMQRINDKGVLWSSPQNTRVIKKKVI